MTPAPSPAEFKAAYIFGFAALGVGVLLAIFIFWALLGGLLNGH